MNNEANQFDRPRDEEFDRVLQSVFDLPLREFAQALKHLAALSADERIEFSHDEFARSLSELQEMLPRMTKLFLGEEAAEFERVRIEEPLPVLIEKLKNFPAEGLNESGRFLIKSTLETLEGVADLTGSLIQSYAARENLRRHESGR